MWRTQCARLFALALASATAASGSTPISALYFTAYWSCVEDETPALVFDVSVDGECVVPGLVERTLSEPVSVSPGAHDVVYFEHAAEPCTGDLKVSARVDVGMGETKLGVSAPNLQGVPTLTAHSIDTRLPERGRARVSILNRGEVETARVMIGSERSTTTKHVEYGMQTRALFLRPGPHVIKARVLDRGGAPIDDLRREIDVQPDVPQVMLLTGHEEEGFLSMLHLVFD